MTTTKANYTRIIDYGITDAFVELDWETQDTTENYVQKQMHSHSFNFQDLAGALWDCGHCDGYTLKNGELLCEMDGRPGFVDTATPQAVWDALHPEDKNKVALYLVTEKEKQQ